MGTLEIILIIIGAVLVLFFVWILLCRSSLVKLRAKTKEAFEQMAVPIRKRYDIIREITENMPENGAAQNAKDALEFTLAAKTMEEKSSRNIALTKALVSLKNQKEEFPELAEKFTALNDAEMEIAKTRKAYNAMARTFNTERKLFPAIIAAKLFRIKPYPFFPADDSIKL